MYYCCIVASCFCIPIFEQTLVILTLFRIIGTRNLIFLTMIVHLGVTGFELYQIGLFKLSFVLFL